MTFVANNLNKTMGVMSCSRVGCHKVTCNTYVDGVGPVCSECQSEFKEYLIKENVSATTDGEILHAVKVFMKTDKGRFAKGKEMSVDDFFKNYTK